MENNALIDALPLWGLFIAILGVVLISVECGYRLGKFRLSRCEQEKEAPVGTMVGATLGLLAFILVTEGTRRSETFNSRCGRKPKPSHRKTSIRLWLVCSRSGAAAVIATKLLLTWRWRFFWLSFLSTFRLPVSLAVID
jgi:hypothetical protein